MFLDEFEKAFNTVCKALADAVIKTEKHLGREMSDSERNLCVGFGLLYLCDKFGKKKRKVVNKHEKKTHE